MTPVTASRQVRRHEDQRVGREEARRGAEAHPRGEHRRLSGQFPYSSYFCLFPLTIHLSRPITKLYYTYIRLFNIL